VDEAKQEGVALGLRGEQPVRDAPLGLAGDRLDDAAVEAFNQAIGLRAVGPCEAVVDLVLRAEAIEGMPA
jgi:hypothetical protein